MTTSTLWAVVAAGFGLALAAYAMWARWRLQRTPGIFACRLSPVGLEERWGRRPRRRYGLWAHDVLIVHRGPSLARTEVLPVATAVGGPAPGPPARGLGADPVRLRLRLDDGRQVELLVSDADVPAAFGPFVVASLTWRKRSGTS